MKHTSWRRARAPLCLAAFAATGFASSAAHAQIANRFALHAELGVGVGSRPISDPDRALPALGGEGALRLGFSLIDIVAVQASVGGWGFLANPTTADLTVNGGFRIEPIVGRLGRIFIDFNPGVAFSRQAPRYTFDMGAGAEFALGGALNVGPFVRYGYFAITDTGVSSQDRVAWVVGGTLSIRAPLAEAPAPVVAAAPTDTDADGVPDTDDQCVAEAQGANPDPARRGCPRRDQDSDGVFDDEDQCVTTAAGDHPDPARRGCPLGDQDGDGVFDNTDQCVTTAAGPNPDPERPGCPDGDDDNDGVRNHADQCRAQHHGAHPDPARPGCPLPDRDNDSVPDPTDHCPDQPGAPHPDPNRNGCPGLVLIRGGQVQINRPVFFATNRDTILPTSFPVLQAVADALRASPDIRRVSVNGHTDDVGDDARNMDLSQRRANSVMAWLVQHGIEAARLEAHGYGETRPTQPITPGMPAPAQNRARAQNRRVEFLIVDPPQQQQPAEGGAPAARPE